MNRRDAILKGAFAVGALYGSTAVGPYVRRALAKIGGDDVHLLSLALEFEYLQVSLYGGAVQRLKPPADLRRLIERLADEERQHVQALTAMLKKLGGKPPAEDRYEFDYPGTPTFLSIAANIELVSVNGYNGLVPSIESDEAFDLAVSIVQVEGRHVATIRSEGGEEPAPEAFDVASTEYGIVSSVLSYTAYTVSKKLQ